MSKRTTCKAEQRNLKANEAYAEAQAYLTMADKSPDDVTAMGYRLTAQLAMLRGAILED